MEDNHVATGLLLTFAEHCDDLMIAVRHGNHVKRQAEIVALLAGGKPEHPEVDIEIGPVRPTGYRHHEGFTAYTHDGELRRWSLGPVWIRVVYEYRTVVPTTGTGRIGHHRRLELQRVGHGIVVGVPTGDLSGELSPASRVDADR